MSFKPSKSPSDVLYRIKRGLSGYVSYLAACEMNEAFSEYVLYEPTLRILTARGYSVKCESTCPGFPKQGRGDRKKIDFEVTGNGCQFVLEMKWARQKRVNVSSDFEKLRRFREANRGARGFLCVFGRKSHLQSVTLNPGNFVERGAAVFAEFGVTRYGCRIYEIVDG